MKKHQLISIGLIISFLICYLEWGGDQSAFIFQAAYLILTNTGQANDNFRHPLILLPFAGLLLFLVTVFLKHSYKWIMIAGISLSGVLVAFIFTAGILSLNAKIVASTLPFIILSIIFLRSLSKK